MKKFKVIEESRFLNKQEMQNLDGGACAPVTSICTVGSPYKSCDSIGINHTTCGGVPFKLDGYDSEANTCGGLGVRYEGTTCGTLPMFTDLCEGARHFGM